MTGAELRERALRAVNVALEPLGLVLRTFAGERRDALEREAVVRGYWQAAECARGNLEVARRDRDRLRRYLLQLDELVEATAAYRVGTRAELILAARRVLDVALGRDVERAA